MTGTKEISCWICAGTDLRLLRKGNLPASLSADAFRISDAHYGCTADLYRCEDCGFIECPTLPDVLPFYENMDDSDYEATREPRRLQAARLLRSVERIKSSGRLLDVGAGSGILVDAARQLGFAAEGIETSYPLWRAALDRGLPVRHGVLPHADVQGPFDLVTVVDVIEHVDDPLGLLGRVRELMTEDGVALIVTPDVRSVAARVMGRYWWHYRIAHIGYFDRDTLTDAARRSGLRVVEMRRPSWYLPVSYLLERLLSYLPRALQVTSWPFLSRWTVRFNLFDSLMVVCRKA